MTPARAPKTVCLALQGGGAHGAFTWGALDRLLEEEALEIEAISATSAGAMNAAMLKTGFVAGGREGARRQLDRFWGGIRRGAQANVNPLAGWLAAFSPEAAQTVDRLTRAPAQYLAESFRRTLSPYDWNPLNINPLRDLLEKLIDLDLVCCDCRPHLFLSATNVRTGKIKVFKEAEISIDAVLASACLPDLFQAVEIAGEHYWDGGFMGNPALYPLFYHAESRDIVIVHVNPIERPDLPRTAAEIRDRVNEISFNSSLLRELRVVHFVKRLLADGRIAPGEMKDVLLHSVRDDAVIAPLGAASKVSPAPELIDRLKAAGRGAADRFLRAHWQSLGVADTVDLRAMYD
ncbi:MAG TPA: patatin-like phospholipase family protein [Thermohalobaculum sp.]|nr:patatin-like phospholipase family protein [Thermohalobaculum sp.]